MSGQRSLLNLENISGLPPEEAAMAAQKLPNRFLDCKLLGSAGRRTRSSTSGPLS